MVYMVNYLNIFLFEKVKVLKCYIKVEKIILRRQICKKDVM